MHDGLIDRFHISIIPTILGGYEKIGLWVLTDNLGAKGSKLRDAKENG